MATVTGTTKVTAFVTTLREKKGQKKNHVVKLLNTIFNIIFSLEKSMSV